MPQNLIGPPQMAHISWDCSLHVYTKPIMITADDLETVLPTRRCESECENSIISSVRDAQIPRRRFRWPKKVLLLLFVFQKCHYLVQLWFQPQFMATTCSRWFMWNTLVRSVIISSWVCVFVIPSLLVEYRFCSHVLFIYVSLMHTLSLTGSVFSSSDGN